MLDAPDILVPRGELEPSLFPLDDATTLAAKVRAWLDKGRALATAAGITDDATLDVASEAYTYWKAYSAALQRIIANPVSNTINDKGTTTYSTEQLKQLAALRDQWANAWLVYVPAPAADDDAEAAAGPNETGTTRSVFTM